ncbi:hypothetical protein R1T16_10245 [Flavobacterium sp. DG1-102-2]|uniref:hypothetical protein n=1 Tax=Flavobacterium sp. DG1-102-2 TaxID=3081663 RepID=UPI00294910A0|nr:hypothetical protein [Flavobacterium sp. DG1-102-2]MDV6168805.1 hypothetical protein [Flavobacterium sp. DG1-102-2]
MKKIFAMAAIALFMVSCSDDDSNSTQTNVKLTKVIETDMEGTLTSTLIYNGNKLVQINSSDGTKNIITYTGDLITEETFTGPSNEIIWKYIYQYNSQNQLVTYYELDYEDSYNTKTTYVHNSNGSISFTEYDSEDFDLNSFTEKSAEGTITDDTYINKMFSPNGTVTYIDTYSYTYDGKNYPLKGITGYDKIGFAGTDGGKKHGIQNVISQSYTPQGSTQAVVETTTTYTYNGDNFPLTQVETSVGNPQSNTTTQYIYE